MIVEINDQMPRTLGDTFLHVSRADAFIETSHPLSRISAACRFRTCTRAIARHVAPLIPDGATIQTGIGGIPEAVLGLLHDHKDLGMHSEMVPDGVVALMQAGVINGERKTIHPHKVIAGFVLGRQAAVRFHRQQSELRIPPHGVCERSVRHRAERPHGGAQFGDRGGSHGAGVRRFDGAHAVQRDRRAGGFSARRGAVEGRDADHHAAFDGQGRHDFADCAEAAPGAGVVTSRGDVHYVITEHGVAYLHGKTLRQRAEALIQVADPRFRDELERFAGESKLLGAADSDRPWRCKLAVSHGNPHTASHRFDGVARLLRRDDLRLPDGRGRLPARWWISASIAASIFSIPPTRYNGGKSETMLGRF